MIQAFLIGGCVGAGAWLGLRGCFPAPATLAGRLTDFANTPHRSTGRSAVMSFWGRIATRLLRTVRGEEIAAIEADVAVTGGDLESHALDKLKAALGGFVLLPVFGYIAGLTKSDFTIGLAAISGFIALYLLPDVELKRRAQVRRDEFTEVLTAFVSLVAVGITGGGGVNTAMSEATKIGNGWCFEALGRSIEESMLQGEPPWDGFDRLGQRFGLVPLVELAGALSLAGTSGARVTETLTARAESGRNRELTDALAAAEKKSESMNIPVAALMLGWAGFIGYPAIAGLLGG
jgi:tight adherence protein C